ncbi:MAG: hypothetical protein IT424_09010 [Pirellulales bacterium]|nr:hypothetical protein [Pirellulales bacterium]
MSPEQALGKRGLIDHRADVYSLGATLYELVTLRPVYDATDREELLRKIALEEPVRLRLVNRDAPVDLETIVAKTLEKDPAARYATAGELADDLRRFLVAQPILAKPATLVERAVKYVRRHRGLVATAAVALACLIAVLLVSTVLVARAHRRALVALERTSDLLYASDMKLAYEAWERGWDDEVRTLLDRHLPRPGAVDQRGLEWRILDSQVRHPNPVELKGHRGAIQELAVFPNRQAVASVGDDGWLRIWDIAAARQAHAVKISSQPLFAVAVSPSGRYVAVGGMDSAVYLCDAQAEYAARSLYVGGFAVESLAFSPDGQRLAAGFRYDELCLLSIAGDLIQRVPCAARALSLQFVPGTSLLLAPERMLGKPGSPTVVQLWRDDLSQVVQTFDRLDEARPIQTNLAIASPCGQLVLAVEQSKSQAFIFHRTTGRLLSSIPKTRDRILDVAYSPVGDAVAFAYGNGNIEYVSLQRRSDEEVSIAGRRRAMAAHLGEVYCLRFIDDSTLASAGRDGCVRIWRLTVDRPQRPAKGGEPPRRIALSPDGSALACVYRREIVVVDVASERPLFRLGITPGDHDISWSSSSQIIADRPSDAAGPLQLLGRRGEVLWNAPSAMDLEELTVSSDAALAATIGQSQLRLYSVRDRRLLLERALPDTGRHAAFSPRGDMLALGGSWRGATILNLRDSRAATTLACASDTLVLAFSADGLRAASGHSDGAVRVWNSSTGALSATFVGHAAPVHSALFAPDGRTLLTVGVDGAVRIWSVDPPRGYGVVYQSANGESTELPDVGISTDGRWFTIADVDEQGMPVVWRRNVGAATP